MGSAFKFAARLVMAVGACTVGAVVQVQAQTQGQAAPQVQAPADAKPKAEVLPPELLEVAHKLQSQSELLKDWAQLSRYREVNAKLTPPAKDEQRVVFMGDSITDLWVRPEFGGFFPGKPYVGRGIGGQTTPQMLVRFRPDVAALKPKVVVILAGTNDIAGNTGPMTMEEIEGNLASMAELARASGIRVVLSSVLPVSNYGHDWEGKPTDMRIKRPPEKILELNAWIKKYAAENGHVYLDYFPAMVDETGLLKKELSEDGLHPNPAGYAVMAPLAEKGIQAALAAKNPK